MRVHGHLNKRRSVQLGLFLFLLFLNSGCNDTQRLDRLESEIRTIRSDTGDEVATLRERVEAAEAKVGAGGSAPIEQRLAGLEDQIRQVLEKVGDRNDMAYLRSNLNGHTTMRTDHGPFLVRLEGIDLNIGGKGFTAHLNIGNPLALSVQQFLLKGDFGSGVPTLNPGQEYSLYNKQIEEWQRTLKPFEFRVTKPLKPMSWTPIDVVLDANSRDELELIRFSMVIENAHLEGVGTGGGGSGGSLAHIAVDSDSASVLKTDYGAFLIVVKEAESRGPGTKLEVEIGNPYGFSVNQCRLVGDFGPPVPKQRAGETEAKFLGRLKEWTSELKPFNAQIDSKLSSFRWNEASILIPAPVSEVKFLRAELRVENVTLPHVKGR